MKIRTRVILFFSLISLFAVFATFVYLEFFLKTSFVTTTKQNIRQVAELSESTYLAFSEGLKVRTLNWSSDRYVKDLAQDILDPKTPAKERGFAVKEFTRYFQEEKMLNDPTVIIVDLIDKNGFVVASSRASRIGNDEAQEERNHQAHHFSKTINAQFGEVYLMGAVFEKDEDGRPMFHLTTRMFSTVRGSDGKFVPLDGVLLVHFVPLEQFSTLLSRLNQYKESITSEMNTGNPIETFLVNKDGLIVVSTTPNGQDVEVGKIDTSSLSYDCLTTGTENTLDYQNHHGVGVVGASVCLKDDGLVIISEIPKTQAYAILNALTRETIVVWAIVFFFIFTVLLYGGRRILKKINGILSVANNVARGDFSARIPTPDGDEIGLIARAFNGVLDTAASLQENLKQSNKKLEEDAVKLAHDVAQHQEQEKFLEQSKRATLNLLEDTWKTKEGLEIKERRLQAVLTAIPSAVFLIDRNYRIEMVNSRAEKFLGFSARDLIGKDFRTIVSVWKKEKEKIPVAECPMEKMFLSNTTVTTDLEDKLSITTEKYQLHLPVAIISTPLREDVHDTNVKAVVVLRDLTRDRELDEARSGFISIASHQLRTPLTTIRWYSEMLLDEDTGTLSSTQRDFLNEIHGGAERLYKTIDLLLGISRVESGKQKPEPKNIDLTVFTQEILKELSPQSNEKKLVVSMTPPPGSPVVVWLDPLRLRQVVINLLSNAIRYTNTGGLVEVSWTINEHDKEVSYSVRDNGIGVPDKERGNIFKKFFRAENALTQAPDGSGLGLAFVKELVEGWGGQIHFTTAEGKGSTFIVTIPLTSSVPFLPFTEPIAEN